MDLSLISALIKQLLEAQSPDLGARLKQRLTALLVAQGHEPFDVRTFGHRKWATFLEKTQSEILTVDHKADSNDILVSLRTTASATIVPPRAAAVGEAETRIRSDVWQAFASHNPRRKRFLDKHSFAVKHFLNNEASAASSEVAANPQNFVEIQPIAGEEQISWMKDYLNSIPIQGTDRTPLDAMLTQQYSASLNSAFTRALGEKGDAWRHFRTQRVSQVIEKWAAENDVKLDCLRKVAATDPIQPAAKAPIVRDDARARAQKLLQMLSDKDIATVVIPILVSTILVQSRG